MSMTLAAMDRQIHDTRHAAFQRHFASERRRLRNRLRRDGSGSARDRTVSGASYRTPSVWTQWVGESSSIMRTWIDQWNWHVAMGAGMGGAQSSEAAGRRSMQTGTY